MRTIILIALAQILHLHLSYAQGKEDYTWVIGTIGDSTYADYGGMLMSFKTGVPTVTTFNSIDRYPGYSSISDNYGNLLFYTDGCNIYDKNHQIMENGNDLNQGGFPNYYCGHNIDSANYYIGESNLIIPWPKQEGKYKVLHSITYDQFRTDLIFVHSTVDINLNNSIGKVVNKQSVWLGEEAGFLHPGRLHVVRHANGIDWWVLAYQALQNGYYISVLDSSGLSTPILKNIDGGLLYTGGQSSSGFSPNGHFFINTDVYKAQVFEFDRCRGVLYNPITLYNREQYTSTGTAFSQDSRFLYLIQNESEIYQYDLHTDDYQNKAVLVGKYDGYKDEKTHFNTVFTSLALAPDNKIYVSSAQGVNIHIIHHPERKGAACQFIQHQLKLPKISNGIFSLPHYRTPTQVPACDQLVYDSSYCNCRDTLPIARKLSIYPNPALEYVEVSGPPGTEVPLSVEIYDALGRLLIQQHFTCLPGRVSLSGLPATGYFYRIVGADGKAVQESTLVKVNR